MDITITIDSNDAVKTISMYMLTLETVFNSSMQISQKITENELTQKSFVQKFLQSVKQKMYSNQR